MMPSVLGLDIGGANLKAAHSNGAALAVPFPLWKNPDRLADELRALCAALPARDQLAVTMTGELCDCFLSRGDGVQAILHSVRALAGTMPTRIWTSQSRFLTLDQASQTPLAVASANWLAQAHLVARHFPTERVLLIDVGSTTTDIVYLDRGTPRPTGLDDRGRFASGELVYSGLRRTPVCAVLGMEVAAELFATMLDVYLVLRRVPEDVDDRDTADGRLATIAFAHARLARLVCADADTFSETDAVALAARAADTQRDALQRAVERVLQDRVPIDRVVLSGSGEVIGRSLIAKSRLAALPVTSLSELLGEALSDAACAYAVAILAQAEGGVE